MPVRNPSSFELRRDLLFFERDIFSDCPFVVDLIKSINIHVINNKD